MEAFTVIAGVASILSLILSIFAISKVYKLKIELGNRLSSKSNQNIRSKNINQSEIKQAGGDVIEKTDDKVP